MGGGKDMEGVVPSKRKRKGEVSHERVDGILTLAERMVKDALGDNEGEEGVVSGSASKLK